MRKWDILMKKVYRVSLIIVILVPALLLLWRLLPLQFASERIEGSFAFFTATVWMLSMLGTLAGTLKRNDHPVVTVAKLVLTLFVSFFAALIMFLSSIDLSFCGYSGEKTLFINSGNSNITIVRREFGCGATDSGPSTKSIVRRRMITPLFMYITSVDTSTLDKEKWIPVEITP